MIKSQSEGIPHAGMQQIVNAKQNPWFLVYYFCVVCAG